MRKMDMNRLAERPQDRVNACNIAEQAATGVFAVDHGNWAAEV
jgi:hypothetical protein